MSAYTVEDAQRDVVRDMLQVVWDQVPGEAARVRAKVDQLLSRAWTEAGFDLPYVVPMSPSALSKVVQHAGLPRYDLTTPRLCVADSCMQLSPVVRGTDPAYLKLVKTVTDSMFAGAIKDLQFDLRRRGEAANVPTFFISPPECWFDRREGEFQFFVKIDVVPLAQQQFVAAVRP